MKRTLVRLLPRRKPGSQPTHREGRPCPRCSTSPLCPAAPRQSLQIASTFLESYRETHPDDQVQTWDLWDGSLPEFGPAAAGAKMTVFGGGTPEGEQAAAWKAAQDTFARFAVADRLLFSVPMWNAGVPYILKQFTDVTSQPGMVFGVDAATGYTHLLADQNKRAAVIYTSAVWGPALGPEFGADFQSTYFDDWAWTGITDISQIRYQTTLSGDADQARQSAHAPARETAKKF